MSSSIDSSEGRPSKKKKGGVSWGSFGLGFLCGIITGAGAVVGYQEYQEAASASPRSAGTSTT